jgi:hypothetical protein
MDAASHGRQMFRQCLSDGLTEMFLACSAVVPSPRLDFIGMDSATQGRTMLASMLYVHASPRISSSIVLHVETI